MTRRFALAAAIAATLVTLLASVVLSHAPLQSSDPADGATITTPYTLTATFGEELTANGSSLVVQNASGVQVASGTVDPTNNEQMTIDLPQLPDGQYTVLWVSVTADDNGILRGTYHFNVSATANASAGPVATPVPSASNDSSTSAGALVAVGVAVVISVAVLVFVLYRNRR